ncbi:DUF3114 domain-containing protein [Vagococcus coleopterorum]|uniref:DUF3114 domain-containing protein n=1 Tax=Vagococcus coleopterorum TaxID=2714946 RepID=A0A6G8AMU1_9ENTE|nr:DUF3114 domain-containing protein [Vagococcus coleopterorum]QIL46243.1 DUF3114 domain-containing protein [Vagococcus coleopterorum]
MPLNFFKKEINLQEQSVNDYILTITKQLETLKVELSDLKDTDASVNQQQAITNLVANYTPLIEGLQLAFDTLNVSNTELTQSYFAEVKGRKIKSKFLTHRKNKLSLKLNALAHKNKSTFTSWRYHRLSNKHKAIELQLLSLTKLDHLEPDTFSEIEIIQRQLSVGFRNLEQGNTLVNTLDKNSPWLKELEQAQINRIWNQWYQEKKSLPLDSLSEMTKEAYNSFEPIMFYTLYYYDGWDIPAIAAFNNYLIQQITSDELSAQQVMTDLMTKQRQQVGSPAYLILFRNSHYSPLKKIELMLNQLGGEIDEFKFLQLSGPFEIYKDLSPHSRFIELLCQTVRDAYFKREIDSRRLHQFRMYLDRQNLNYIRNNFPSKRDDLSLLNYIKAPLPKGLAGQSLIRERGRLHNKVPDTRNYSDYILEFSTIKRLTPNFHSEFILDNNGMFVSQWNVLKIKNNRVISDPDAYEWTENFERQILNTESLNYATKNDAEHKRLDSIPPEKYDYLIRDKASKTWSSPTLNQYSFKQVDNKKNRKV